MQQQILDYYGSTGVMTEPDRYRSFITALPDNVGELVDLIQKLVIHMYVAEPFYGATFDNQRIDAESNIRQFSEILGAAIDHGNGKLQGLQPKERVIGVCHHFALLLTGILRVKGIPARMRYGFGDYFNPGFYEDHSLCEYWNSHQKRWVLVDPQFDEHWIKSLHIQHDILDVPREHFLVAADAWRRCRAGELDASKFGIFNGDLRGLWFVAGSLIRDVAALNKIEMLQWDTWSGMPRQNSQMKDKKRLAFLDTLADLTVNPDAHFDEVRSIYADESAKVLIPKMVFNAMRRHLEYV